MWLLRRKPPVLQLEEAKNSRFLRGLDLLLKVGQSITEKLAVILKLLSQKVAHVRSLFVQE
jgi:hypothetical protein